MDAMTPRRWDVGRALVLVAVLGLVASACGQARAAAPPEPQFISGERAAPTVVTVPESGGTELIEPEDVEPDIVPVGDAPTGTDAPIDLDRMVIVDDAGVAVANQAGWDRFDATLSQRLGGNQAFSVAVMVGGEIIHEYAEGARVVGGDAVSTADRFRIASISKTITAIVTMELVGDGVLTLDDPIGDVITGHLGIAQPDADAASVTVRELLSHTAGFPKYESMFFGSGATTCADAAVQALTNGVSSGGSYRYSNMSYCVLGLLIEAVTGKAYERVVSERLLQPLGIEGMRITSTYEVGPDEVAHAITPGRNYMETLGAAGAWNATPADLVTIINALDPATPGWKAVSADAARSMRFRIDTGQQPSGYGLGLINYESDSWGHTGTIQNIHAMVLHQADGITWAVTVAGSSPSSTGQLRHIVRSALRSAFG